MIRNGMRRCANDSGSGEVEGDRDLDGALINELRVMFFVS